LTLQVETWRRLEPNGQSRAKTKKECLAKAAEARDAHRKGVLVTGPRQTFGAYLDRWLDNHIAPNRAKKTTSSYRQMARLHIKPALGNLTLASITAARLEDLYRVKRETLAPRTVAYLHAIIRSALARAERQGTIGFNPCRRVEPPRSKRPEIQPLSLEEAMQFLTVASTDRLAAMWTLALHTGLRQGELLGLRWQDVDNDRMTLTVAQTIQVIDGAIEKGRGKSDKARRTIPIPGPAATAMRQWKARQNVDRLKAGPAWTDSGLVFTSSVGTPLFPRNVSRRFHQLLDAAKIERRGMHTTRHTTATLLLAANEHPKVVQELLGHSQISLTLDTYSHVMPGMRLPTSSAPCWRSILVVRRPNRAVRWSDRWSAPRKSPRRSFWRGLFLSGRVGEPPGTRTLNRLIKSQLLCQLS